MDSSLPGFQSSETQLEILTYLLIPGHFKQCPAFILAFLRMCPIFFPTELFPVGFFFSSWSPPPILKNTSPWPRTSAAQIIYPLPPRRGKSSKAENPPFPSETAYFGKNGWNSKTWDYRKYAKDLHHGGALLNLVNLPKQYTPILYTPGARLRMPKYQYQVSPQECY